MSKSRKQLSLLAFISLSTSISLTQIAFVSDVNADAYSWLDKNGNKLYGTKPPKGARSVSSLKTRKLSRYSSKTVLERVVNKDNNIELSNSTDESNTKTRSRLNPSRQSNQAQNEEDNKQWSFEAAELKSEAPEITLNQSGEVSDCRVFVENSNDFNAGDISVSFEFSDGTLIPAHGPSEIAANSSAEFLIHKDFLPLAIDSEDGDLPSSAEVISHGFKR